MNKTDYKLLIKDERSKIVDELHLGFNSAMWHDSMLKKIASGKNIIDPNTGQLMTKERILRIKSVCYGKNPDGYVELFPNEDDSILYSLIKHYAQICIEDKEYLEKSGYGFNQKNSIEPSEEELQREEWEIELRQVALKNCKKENQEKFLFQTVSGHPPDDLFYFLKLDSGNKLDIIIKTLPPWFNGIEKFDFTKTKEELTKPFIFIAGSIDMNNYKIEENGDWLFEKKIIAKLEKRIKGLLNQDTLKTS